MVNSSLNRAKINIDDEFYTRLMDIEEELYHYRRHFKGKIIFCNCDDPFESNFFKYFAMNFNFLGLKKLICTCYATSPIMYTQLDMFGNQEPIGVMKEEKKPYKIEITEVKDVNGDGAVDLSDVEYLLKNDKNVLSFLKGDSEYSPGDFRSKECKKLLDECDIVVTNPPFSLFVDFLNILIEYKKKFIIIGSQPKITNLDLFPLIQSNKMWLGNNNPAPKQFYVPRQNNKKNVTVDDDGQLVASFGNVCWFTNLDIDRIHENLILTKHYNPQKYPTYDNYDAIECKNIKDIPIDYTGVIGVYPGFLTSYNPEQFEIVGVVSAPKNPGSLNLGKDYRQYIGYKQNGQKNGRTGSTFGRNAVLLGDDGIHDYYEKDGVRVHSASARIFIRYTKKWISEHPQDFEEK